MSSFTQFFNSHLNFTTREKTGIIGLLILMALFYFLPKFLFKEHDYSKELKAFEKEIAQLDSSSLEMPSNNGSQKFSKNVKSWKPFYFDPNTVDAHRLENFGFPPYLIARITKYRLAGAKFYKKEDLLKVYGLNKDLYILIEPFMVFEKPLNRTIHHDTSRKNHSNSKTIRLVDLNTADSLALIEINGIGPYLSSKILAYRNALGGFVSIDQLYEIYTIKPDQIERIKMYITIDKNRIKRLNVNTADYSELNSHPYLSSKEANAIINYRKQHGNYTSNLDLEKVIVLSKESLRKLEMYLAF